MNKKQQSELLPLLAKPEDWKKFNESKDDLSFDDVHNLLTKALCEEYEVEHSYDCPYFVYKMWSNKMVAKRSYGSSSSEHCLFKMFDYSVGKDDDDDSYEAEISNPVEVNQMFVPIGSEPSNAYLAVREADEQSTDDPEFVKELMEGEEEDDDEEKPIEVIRESTEENKLRETGEFKSDFFDTPLTESKVELIQEGKSRHYVIRNVSMLAEFSKNQRRYSAKVQREAVPIFEGIKAYADHPTKANEKEPRRVKETIGRYRGVRFLEAVNKTYGDLHLVPTKLVTDYIIPIAESDPSLIGSSINAFGKMDSDGNVESITRAQSVDLVTEPATTQGLHEAVDKGIPKIKEGEEPMTFDEVLKDEALMNKLREHVREELDIVKSYEEKENQIKVLSEQVASVQKDSNDKIKALEEENAKLKLADQARATEAEISAMLAESKLPEEAKKEVRPLLDKAADAEERKQLLKRMEDLVEGVKKGTKTTSPSVHTERKIEGAEVSERDLTTKVFESFRARR
jgi:hypothetical protein